MHIRSIRFYSLILPLTLALFVVSCKQDQEESEQTYTQYEGPVFGTYYRIKIDSDNNFKPQIDSVFQAINTAANSYVGASEITSLNSTGKLENPSPTFLSMIKQAQHFQQITKGYFEPALYPLIKAWRFEQGGATMQVDSLELENLMSLLPMEESVMISDTLIKVKKEGTKIDLSAMGEGYAIEGIHQVLIDAGIENYMIEIGGEIFARGLNEKGKTWTIGIEDPSKAATNSYDNIITKVQLSNQGISTSGSYRKFYTDDQGNKYPHIINPKTGYPVQHHLVSVSIKAASPLVADTYATACMAMGTEKAKAFIAADSDVELFMAYYVKDSLKTWNSPNFYKIATQ
ncbi:FAD:protein FMN transferase [Galbibacter sp.]|jgi:thiamine biosynthesis lipoprotein|uniref:FAD:protein FMN transferase n=1 Tax=Galbibacter sp. TaxID=2918471 RepID=UPI003A915FA2